EIAFSEDNVFERAKIAQARPPIIEDFFTPFERAPNIPLQKLLQNDATDAIVEQTIVAPIERAYATKEACVAYDNHRKRQGDHNGRQQKMLPSGANKHPDNGEYCHDCQCVDGEF